MDINGKSVLITGAASGLGFATASRLSAEGARVIAVDLPNANRSELDEIDAIFVGADVTDEHAVLKAVDLANESGDLAAVINCAGIGTAAKTAGSRGAFPLEKFEQVLKVNLIGTFNVLRLAAQSMLTNDIEGEERGVIINTASIAAYDGQVGQAAYSASKAAVAGLTLPVARDLAPHLIRVMTIAPGLFETPMLASLPQEAHDSLIAQTLHPHRLGMPTEFAQMVSAIIQNPMLNGETIRLDGAIRMGPR